MIDNSIEELFTAINNSNEYKEYLSITNKLNNNEEIMNLIEEIKLLEQEATKLEYAGDDKYQDIDKEIKSKIEILNGKNEYQEYLSRLKQFNNALLSSSSLLQEYIDEKLELD